MLARIINAGLRRTTRWPDFLKIVPSPEIAHAWQKRDGGNGDVFGYDKNDQANAFQLDVPNPDTTQVGSPNITFDPNGNRLTFVSDTYVPNNLNQYSSRNSNNAAYDPNGNMTTGVDGSTYTYDSQNRLLTATKNGTTYTFTYDGLNRQVSRKIGTASPAYNVYDGWQLIGEYNPNATSPLTAYLTGAGGLVKGMTASSSWYYYQDASGSTSHLADNTGHLSEWYRYDLHGTPMFYNSSNTQLSTSSYGIRHLFTGQQWYSEIGLYDLRNRAYSPDIGRFLQADPVGFLGGKNLYRYGRNNPLKYIDPMGLATAMDPGYQPDHGPSADANGVHVIGDPVDPFNVFKPWGIQSFSPGQAMLMLGIWGGGSGIGGGGTGGFSIRTGVSSPLPSLGDTPFPGATPPNSPTVADYLTGWMHDAELFASWATGIGNGDVVMGPNSTEAEMMQSAPGVLAAIANFWWNNTGVTDWSQTRSVQYQSNFGASGYLAAGLNPTQQFLGSYTVYVSASGPNAVNVTVWNQTSLRSAMADWSAIQYYDRGSFPFGANIYQTITFNLPYP